MLATETASTALARIDTARLALEAATSLEGVLNIRDSATRLEAACRAAGATLAVMNRAVELKVRAERIAGKWLHDAVKPGRKKNGSPTRTISLADIDVTKKQSSRWQRLASVPDDAFEKHVAAHTDRELTTKSVLQLAARQPSTAPLSPNGKTRSATKLTDVAGEKFACIYADPPWQYGNQSTRASTDNHYSTMTVDQIAAMPVADYAAGDAHLHIWTTNAFLPDTFRVIEAWGFEYRSCFVWVKPQLGIGNYWRVSHEFLLLGIRGDAKRFNDRTLKSWGEFERTKHSAKPEDVRLMIEKASPGPYLELFGRKPVEGWTVFGNQIEQRLFAG